jgi:hypothetical protein
MHEDFSGTGFWSGNFFETKNFGTAELVDLNGFHERSPG